MSRYPEQIKFIYGSKDWDFAQMVVDIFKGVIPKSMLANKSGALVSYHRKAFAYAFSHAFLTLSASVFNSHFRILLQQWDARSRAGNEKEGAFIPALEGLELLGTDVMSQVMYGDSYNQLSSGKRHTMTKDFATILSTLTDGPFNVFISWVKRLNPAYRAANRRGIAYVVERVEKARQKIRGGGEIERVESMIDIIMRKEARDGEGRVMAEDELRDELSTFMFAGSDTSSSTQLWVLKFLSENPSVQERLHDDLIRALPLPDERAPTLDEITPEILPYLEAVVQECSRLAQTIPFTERQATCDTTLFGSNGETYFIPAGTQVFLLNGWATRHQGPDSESFRPERWLDEKGAYDGNRVWSISFGGGNRKCYGHKLALVFLRLFIAQLSLSHFVLPLPSHLKILLLALSASSRSKGLSHSASYSPSISIKWLFLPAPSLPPPSKNDIQLQLLSLVDCRLPL
ncbi:cytochrome P450 [Mrakia frigida]|uniref:cytochrome P450 n=1 Tax=Mrakia frigida TaxID=29902 RepID=UPI003FCBF28A